MTSKQIHFISGLTISLFVLLHLTNHLVALGGADRHIEMMNQLRIIYRNSIAESFLLIAVVVQIGSGLQLAAVRWKKTTRTFDRLHLWSGLYLAFFLAIHVSAIVTGRFLLHLDTNFYFGVAGLNTFPINLFFIPYYALAIISFFAHAASIHSKKMKRNLLTLKPDQQAWLILGAGLILTLIILYGLTNGFKGVEIPPAYAMP